MTGAQFDGLYEAIKWSGPTPAPHTNSNALLDSPGYIPGFLLSERGCPLGRAVAFAKDTMSTHSILTMCRHFRTEEKHGKLSRSSESYFLDYNFQFSSQDN